MPSLVTVEGQPIGHAWTKRVCLCEEPPTPTDAPTSAEAYANTSAPALLSCAPDIVTVACAVLCYERAE